MKHTLSKKLTCATALLSVTTICAFAQPKVQLPDQQKQTAQQTQVQQNGPSASQQQTGPRPNAQLDPQQNSQTQGARPQHDMPHPELTLMEGIVTVSNGKTVLRTKYGPLALDVLPEMNGNQKGPQNQSKGPQNSQKNPPVVQQQNGPHPDAQLDPKHPNQQFDSKNPNQNRPNPPKVLSAKELSQLNGKFVTVRGFFDHNKFVAVELVQSR